MIRKTKYLLLFFFLLPAALFARDPDGRLFAQEHPDEEEFSSEDESDDDTNEQYSETQEQPVSFYGVPWRFSWSVSFEGILKFTDNKVGFNPLFLYNDKMLNRNTFKLNLTVMPSDFYSAVVYTYLNIHLRNIYDQDNPEEGDFLFRNRYGIGTDQILSFRNGMTLLFGLEYRLDQSDWNSFKHRLGLRTSLKGSGTPGLSWSVEQKALPFFTVKAGGLSSFETETLLYAEYDFLKRFSPPGVKNHRLKLYNDFYLDTTSYPDGSETEYYLEETIGLKAGIGEITELIFGPTYFFHNLSPYKNVSLAGFKSGAVFTFATKPVISDEETVIAGKKYTLSAFYWGAFHFGRETWDHLLQVSFAVAYPGVTQRSEKTAVVK